MPDLTAPTAPYWRVERRHLIWDYWLLVDPAGNEYREGGERTRIFLWPEDAHAFAATLNDAHRGV